MDKFDRKSQLWRLPERFVLSLSPRGKQAILTAVDLAMVPCAYAFALSVHYSALLPLEPLLAHWPLVPLLALAVLALSVPLSTARGRLKDFDRGSALRLALLSALLAGGSLALGKLGGPPIRNGYHIVFGLLFFVLAAGARIALLLVLQAIYRNSGAVTRVLIYGAGRSGMTLAALLRGRPDIVPVAFIDDNATLNQLVLAGLPVVPGARAIKVAEQLGARRVILAMPSLSQQRQALLSRRLEREGLEVMTLPAYAQLTGSADLIDKLTSVRAARLISREPHGGLSGAEDEVYRGANVLVSGAGGTIGLELCRQIIEQKPRRLVLFEQSEYALYRAEQEISVLGEGLGTEIVAVLGSVADAGFVSRILQTNGISILLHAAAYKHVGLVEDNVIAGVVNNALGTAVIAQAARDAGVARFVLISTDKAVRPVSIMGKTKRVAELAVQDLASRRSSTIFSIVRFGNVLGSSGSVVPLFQEQIAGGGPITLTNPDATRYFMTTQEAVRLVLRAGTIATGGEVFVLDMGEPVRVLDLAKRMVEASGFSLRDEANPEGDIEIIVTGLKPGEKLHEEPMVISGGQVTSHQKILAVPAESLSEIEVAALLRDLREGVEAGDESALRHHLDRAALTGTRRVLPQRQGDQSSET
jgi:FlaA1/EpsC-like NDP-sugar epimerase